MNDTPENDHWAVTQAREIAQGLLDGAYDPLLACRDLARFRLHLPRISEEIMDTFVATASEVDDLPLGPERQHWAPAALKVTDARAAEYRGRISHLVEEAAREFLKELG